MSAPLSSASPEIAARLALAEQSGVYHRFDEKRFSWLAALLREAGQSGAADLAESWAAEHRALAGRAAR